MEKPSVKEETMDENNVLELRKKIMGLGKTSIRKSYYKALQGEVETIKLNEKRVQELFDHISGIVILLNKKEDGYYINYMSSKARKEIEVTKQITGDLINRKLGEVVECLDSEEYHAILDRVDKGEDISESEPVHFTCCFKGWFLRRFFKLPTGEFVISLEDHTMVKETSESKAKVEQYEQMKKILTETIKAISMFVEKRDPYTSGHQKRVAQLCVAIGKKLNLTEQEIEGLQFGSMIHDLGKIYLPSDILNRPGKLSKEEFELIKTHAGIGYEILKDINFPWPVKEIILNHHERLDGSGYPNKLTDTDISPLSRVISVSDVVEAIMSHRPYRPALGIDVALEEIKNNKGKLYDEKVVDACVELFEKDGFKFE